MFIINYSHASELEQVHREDTESKLCNQAIRNHLCVALQASPTTPTLSRKASMQVSHDRTHTATHTNSTSPAGSCEVSQRPHEPETTDTVNSKHSTCNTPSPHLEWDELWLFIPTALHRGSALVLLNSEDSLHLATVQPLCRSKNGLSDIANRSGTRGEIPAVYPTAAGLLRTALKAFHHRAPASGCLLSASPHTRPPLPAASLQEHPWPLSSSDLHGLV